MLNRFEERCRNSYRNTREAQMYSDNIKQRHEGGHFLAPKTATHHQPQPVSA